MKQEQVTHATAISLGLRFSSAKTRPLTIIASVLDVSNDDFLTIHDDDVRRTFETL